MIRRVARNRVGRGFRTWERGPGSAGVPPADGIMQQFIDKIPDLSPLLSVSNKEPPRRRQSFKNAGEDAGAPRNLAIEAAIWYSSSFYFEDTMTKSDLSIDHELLMGARYMAQRLMPVPGAIPHIPGTDIYGVSIPFNGIAGGDLITYVNFQERFDLDARIKVATSQGQEAVAKAVAEA